ncbi:hypothetical protein OS190_09355 [Sulfitobacter sp. F26204]|uniref:hypothetical protein n=1 Tax=Sulfitobacter sp. F26204 TaxID=2996014 RepID=UPI00225DF026|nr:hypothetical protein [Sulfitobacter sp. F26204]MCX7559773.1 hypothetical protein [Sulfitobacter sp. F26204]
MGRISAHLDELSEEVKAIELAIGDEVGTIGLQTSGSIKRLQSLDFLRQSLADLALLSKNLSQKHDVALTENLKDNLRLDVTRTLVTGAQFSTTLDRFQKPNGDVELF